MRNNTTTTTLLKEMAKEITCSHGAGYGTAVSTCSCQIFWGKKVIYTQGSNHIEVLSHLWPIIVIFQIRHHYNKKS